MAEVLALSSKDNRHKAWEFTTKKSKRATKRINDDQLDRDEESEDEQNVEADAANHGDDLSGHLKSFSNVSE